MKFNHLQPLEKSCEGGATKTKAHLKTVEAASVDTLEQSSPPSQINTALPRDVGDNEVVVEVLDQKGPGQHAKDEVLVDPEFHETVHRVAFNNIQELVELVKEQLLDTCLIKIMAGPAA
jgi:hypothetical protein